MTALSVAVCSIAPTRRRRFLWAAWWSGAPTRHPFRNPDAHGGGARSEEEALAQAEQATGRALVPISPQWARAWSRVMQGEPPFPRPATLRMDGAPPPVEPLTAGAPPTSPDPASTWALLGVPRTATLLELKRAYRKRALETHPDQGGDPDAFRALQRAYERAVARHRRRRS